MRRLHHFVWLREETLSSLSVVTENALLFTVNLILCTCIDVLMLTLLIHAFNNVPNLSAYFHASFMLLVLSGSLKIGQHRNETLEILHFRCSQLVFLSS